MSKEPFLTQIAQHANWKNIRGSEWREPMSKSNTPIAGDSSAAPTPTPWHRESTAVCGQESLIAYCIGQDAPGIKVSVAECFANAEFIVRAANSFDALLEACKSALDEMEHLEYLDKLQYFDTDKLRAAIQLAEKP